MDAAASGSPPPGEGPQNGQSLQPQHQQRTQASVSISQPESFNFSIPAGWTQWLRRFERYICAARLNDASDKEKAMLLTYCMGGEVEDVLTSLCLSEEDLQDYTAVKQKLSEYFLPRKNVIFERARFNRRCQEEGETALDFITDLHRLSEYCEYGNLRQELIRDRIVVGIRDRGLSETLQLDNSLTLSKAKQTVCQKEEVRKQQQLIRPATGALEVPRDAAGTDVAALHNFKPGPSPSQEAPTGWRCGWCGGSQRHSRKNCKAKDATCHKCHRSGHFAVVCRQRGIRQVESAPMAMQSDVNCVGTSESATKRDTGSWLNNVNDGKGYTSTSSFNTGSESAWSVYGTLAGKRIQLKVDTGADVTVVPYSLFSELPVQPSDIVLRGPSKNTLCVVGSTLADISVGKRNSTQQIYVVDGLNMPLLGLPAIKALGILPSPRIDAVDTQPNVQSKTEVQQAYPSLFNGLGCLHVDPYHISLCDGCTPHALHTARKIAFPLLPAVKEELARMEKLEVVYRVQQPTDWCAGLVVVPKPNGKVRLCVDYTKLNNSVRRERLIMPDVQTVLSQIGGGAQVFSKLDANSGFFQIPIDEESQLLTTFITPFGRYAFRRLPFGITSAPEHFQRRMMEVLEGLDGNACLMDDILMYGSSLEEHNECLNAVLKRLSAAGITLNADKCQFHQTKVQFVGHIIDQHGIHADPEKVSAITEMDACRNVADVRRFLGMVSQLSKFSPQLATLTEPLRSLLQAKSEWTWDTPQEDAFRAIKAELSSTRVLAFYNPTRETVVSADPISFGIGAVLLQKQENSQWQPIVYASRAMSGTERRYAQIEKEALASTWACDRFSQYLIGKKFTLETDHKPLVPLLGSKDLEDLPPRILRF